MNLLSVDSISKSYGIRVLFENVSFGIEEGQKVALVARNGAGKTTLLRIITGKDTPDSGKVILRKDIKVGYLDQDPDFPKNVSIQEAIFSSNSPVINAIKEYELAVELSQQNHNDENASRLEKAIAQMDLLKAWDYEVKIKEVLSKLDIHHLNQNIDSLSGGQRKRVALAKLIIDEPQLIIMDEPTNHLDLDMIEWMEGYLQRSEISLLLVTHDRYFLDRVCNEILELDNQTLYRYKGNYSYFLEKKAEREFNEAREIDKARNLMRKELEWIRKMPKARGTKSKSRINAFYDLKDKASQKKAEQELQLNVKMSRIGGKILELKKLYKSYGDKVILKGFDYTFRKGERIGIVGKNGIGKSTFLNILAGIEQPDSGKVNVGETIVIGYYSQKGIQLKEDKRVIEVVKEIGEFIPMGDGSKLSASQLLTLFQFPPEMQYTYVSKLSGGEKKRLYLMTVLMKNPNFLILDEPTNDLDLLTLNTLEDFLLNFQGCLIIVSHDRYFMDKLVDQLFIFEGDGVIKGFTGNYSDYREIEREQQKEAKEEKRENEKEINKDSTSTTNSIKTKLSYKEKFELEQIEKELPILEQQKEEINNQLNSGKLEHQKIIELSEMLAKLSEEIDVKTMRWLELSEKV
ncbi:MAG: ABC-F family ATP-binding cassette domain-containing protein [Bacteroidia bacterium]